MLFTVVLMILLPRMENAGAGNDSRKGRKPVVRVVMK